MSYFDYKPEVRVAYCKICKRATRQSRERCRKCEQGQPCKCKSRPLFTCRDPQHIHPNREQQNAGITRPGALQGRTRRKRKRGGPVLVREALANAIEDGALTGGTPIGPEDFGGKDY